MTGLTRAIDLLSLVVFRLSFLPVAGMIVVIAIEVFSRYVLGSPTAYAFDLTYMFNGAILTFAASWTLRENGHVRVDIIDSALGNLGRRVLDTVFFLAFCTPILAVIAYFAVTRAWGAFTSGEIEAVSPWRPLIWPFQAALALGLVMLTLQCFAEGLKRIFMPVEPFAASHPETL